MYLVVRRVNGKELAIAKLKNEKAAGIVRDAARYRRPHWDIGVVYTDNPEPSVDPVAARMADAN